MRAQVCNIFMWRAVLTLQLVEIEEWVNRCPWEWSQPWPEKQWPLTEWDVDMLIADLLTAPVAALDKSQVCEISSICLMFRQLNSCNRELPVGCRLRFYLLCSIRSNDSRVLVHTQNLPFWVEWRVGAGAAGPPGNTFMYTFASRGWLALSAAMALKGSSPSQARIFFSNCFRIFCYSACPEIQTGTHCVGCQRATCGSPGDWVIFLSKALLCLVLCVIYIWGCTISGKVLQDVHSKSASADQGSQWPEQTQQQRLICSDQSQHRLFCCLECDFCLIKTHTISWAIAQALSCSFVIQCISL